MDGKSAPRKLRTAIALAEQFCRGTNWETDVFARKVAHAWGAAEQAANDARAIPKVAATMGGLSDAERDAITRRYGRLESMSAELCEVAYSAAHSVACTLTAVSLTTLARYDAREVAGDSYLNRIPPWIAEALIHGPPTVADLVTLRQLAAGETFPSLGAPVDASDSGPLGSVAAERPAP